MIITEISRGIGKLPQLHRLYRQNSPYPTEVLGDLAWHDRETSLHIINSAVRRFVENRNGHSPNVDEDSRRFYEEIYTFRNFVNSLSQQNEESILSQYQRDDVRSGITTEEIARERLSGANISIVTDVDGTITTNPKDYLLKLPGSAIGEEQLEKRGRDSFPDVFASTWKQILEKTPSLFRKVGQEAELRKGTKRFFHNMQEKKIPITTLSASFEPFVHGVLDQLNVANIPTISVTPESVLATDKGSILRFLVIQNPDKALVYIGDGASDFPALDAQKNIAWFFALEGSKFDQELKKRNISHHSTFKNFHDIQRQLSQAA